MPFVVTARCKKDTSCVDVCPVDCIVPDATMVYIDPDRCIDCDLCRVACPYGAIYHEDKLPERFAEFADLNRKRSQK
ncbi:MAG TPA: 4Fe-4S binding protein, partial [Ilumatobacteraceae bacterium]|nr:4Fe-4S binding protein [Ilumatobacteraceae bacterium]